MPGGQRYRSPGAIAAEGDWAAAALWMAANRLGCDIRIEGLPDDTVLMDRRMPALMGQPEIDARNVPDLVPALAAVAAALPQRTVFTGAARLRLKESDRLASIAAMLKALGGRAEVTGDGLIIDGGQPLRGGTVDGANDHRIVMAAAVLAVRCESPVRIIGAQAVEKSSPEFFNDYVKLGGRVHVEPTGQ